MTHGKIQNAGIVRKNTPKVAKKYPNRKSPIPRIRNKLNYSKRVLNGKPIGQGTGTRRR